MPLQTIYSPELKGKLAKLFKRDQSRYEILMKKIEQIVASDEQTIEHYKNLRHDQSNRKRVHIDKSFVLTFKFDKKNSIIEFLDFDHHDNTYEK